MALKGEISARKAVNAPQRTKASQRTKRAHRAKTTGRRYKMRNNPKLDPFHEEYYPSITRINRKKE